MTSDLIKALRVARRRDPKLNAAILRLMKPEAIIDDRHYESFHLPDVKTHGFEMPDYTGNTDTAMGLIPPGWFWNASAHDHDGIPQFVVMLISFEKSGNGLPQMIPAIGETLPLAFCIAALTALTP